MTRRSERVYPVRVPQRDLHLHRQAAAALGLSNWRDIEGATEVLKDLRHRIACAERWEETRTKRLTDYEKWITVCGLRRTLMDAMNDGAIEDARCLARSLVRITRDPA